MYKSLKSNQCIQATLRDGKKLVSGSFSVFVEKEQSLEIPEAAFAAGKKSFKTAVSRNKVKRKLREAFRGSQLRELKYRFVFVGRLSILENDIKSIISEMDKVYKKLCQS